MELELTYYFNILSRDSKSTTVRMTCDAFHSRAVTLFFKTVEKKQTL